MGDLVAVSRKKREELERDYVGLKRKCDWLE